MRCELYIDVGDQDSNKQLFDAFHSERNQIEQEIGRKLEWERLDDKRASRIALYEPGSISVTNEELSRIHKWVVTTLLSLKRVFGPRLQKASGAPR